MTAILITFAIWFAGAFGFAAGLLLQPIAALAVLFKRLKL